MTKEEFFKLRTDRGTVVMLKEEAKKLYLAANFKDSQFYLEASMTLQTYINLPNKVKAVIPKVTTESFWNSTVELRAAGSIIHESPFTDN